MIEVFADVVCPFTHVGLRRVVERRDATGADVQVRVKAWPLEWVNGRPLDPAVVGDEIDALRTTVAADLFRAFDPATFPRTSVPALTLASRAYSRDVATGEAVSLALRDAIFERGLDVADPVVLADLGAPYGLDTRNADEREVRAEYEEGRAIGVVGSPYFVLGTEGFFCPSLEVHHLDGRYAVRFDREAFEAFVTKALGPDPLDAPAG
jgi:predicted DsbA family dithiol-disulfide isomerase